MMSSTRKCSHLMKLAPEIRQMILEEILLPAPLWYDDSSLSLSNIYQGLSHSDWPSGYIPHCSVQILRVCRTLYEEGVNILYGKNIFEITSLNANCLPELEQKQLLDSAWIENSIRVRMGPQNWSHIRHIHLTAQAFHGFTTTILRWLFTPEASIWGLALQNSGKKRTMAVRCQQTLICLLPQLRSLTFSLSEARYQMQLPFLGFDWHKLEYIQSYSKGWKFVLPDSKKGYYWKFPPALARVLTSDLMHELSFIIVSLVALFPRWASSTSSSLPRIFEVSGNDSGEKSILITKDRLPKRGKELDLSDMQKTLEDARDRAITLREGEPILELRELQHFLEIVTEMM